MLNVLVSRRNETNIGLAMVQQRERDKRNESLEKMRLQPLAL